MVAGRRSSGNLKSLSRKHQFDPLGLIRLVKCRRACSVEPTLQEIWNFLESWWSFGSWTAEQLFTGIQISFIRSMKNWFSLDWIGSMFASGFYYLFLQYVCDKTAEDFHNRASWLLLSSSIRQQLETSWHKRIQGLAEIKPELKT